MKKHIAWGVIAVLALMLGGMMLFVGCGASPAANNDPSDPEITIPEGDDGAMAWDGEHLTIAVRKEVANREIKYLAPGRSSRLVPIGTARIDVRIWCPEIPTANQQTGTISWPKASSIRLSVPKGIDRVALFYEYNAAGELLISTQVAIGVLHGSRTGLSFDLTDELVGTNNSPGNALPINTNEWISPKVYDPAADTDLTMVLNQNVQVGDYSFVIDEVSNVTVRLRLSQVSMALATNLPRLTLYAYDGSSLVAAGNPIGVTYATANPNVGVADDLSDILIEVEALPVGRYIAKVDGENLAGDQLDDGDGENHFAYQLRVMAESAVIGGDGS